MSNSEHPHEKTPEASSEVGATPSGVPNLVPSSGRRQAFDDVIKPLTPEELSSPGTQKLVLYMLEKAQSERDQLEGYVERFHDADKRAAVLQEKYDSQSKVSKATEIAVMSGTTLGGVLMGFASYFWSKQPPDMGAGWFVLICGLGLLVCSVAVKVARR